LRQEVYTLIEQLGWDAAKAKEECTRITGVASPRLKAFTAEKAQEFISYLRDALPQGSASSETIDNDMENVA
jgi:hypothetical protein